MKRIVIHVPTADLRDLLPIGGHIGVACPTCNARAGVPCQAMDGPARRPHAAREHEAWTVRSWLFVHGVDCNEWWES